MDKYFEALQKSKGSIALSIADQVGYDGTADVLEKGRAAAMGEIREWNGIRYQKTPKGWVPVKQQAGASKTEPEKKEVGGEKNHKGKGRDFLNMNYSEARTEGPKILGDVMGLKSSDYGQQSLRKEGDDFYFELVSSVKDDKINRLIIYPTEFSNKLSSKSVQKKLENFFGIKVERDTFGNGKFFGYIIDRPQESSKSEAKEETEEPTSIEVTKENIRDVVSDTVMNWIEDMDWDTKPENGKELLENEDFVEQLFEDWGEAFSPEKDEDDIRKHWEDVEKVVSEYYDGYMKDHKDED